MAQEYPKTRADMVSFIQGRMEQSFGRYQDEKKLDYGGGLLKSYFLEADGDAQNNVYKVLKDLGGGVNFNLRKTEEKDFYVLEKFRTGGMDIYFLDATDNRFWLLHTLGIASYTDRFADSFLKTIHVDSAWLPMQFLESMLEKGQFKGYSGRFDNEPFIKDEEDISRISLKLWGNLAPEVLQTFHADKNLRKMFSLSGIRIKSSIEEERFIIDDLTYRGKATAMGDSLVSHLDFVDYSFRDKYKHAIVDTIEGKHAIYAESNHIHGEPIFITFDDIELDFKQFITAIFSASTPFRLWGLSEIIKDDFARVYAVDMHVGAKLTFEIFKDGIRIYLIKGACGNSIARFYTLFQQHYDSSAKLITGNNEQLF